MISRRTFARGLLAFLLCGIIALNCAFAGSCGKTATPCADPPCAAASPDPQAEKAKAIAWAREIARQFQIITPLITENHPEAAATLAHVSSDADKLISAVAASNNTEIVSLLADLAPTFTQIVDQYTDNIGVQLALVAVDEALSFFADRFGNAVQQGAISRSASRSGPSQAILRFRDGAHLRIRDKKTGRFVSLDYALAHKEDVNVEKVAR